MAGIIVPVNVYEWKSFFKQLAKAYKISVPPQVEKDHIESVIAAFIADYPKLAYRFGRSDKVLHEKVAILSSLLDDVDYPLMTGTLVLATSLVNSLDIDRLTGAEVTVDQYHVL